MPELTDDYVVETPDGPTGAVDGGLWTLNYDQLVLLDAAWTGRPVVFVPSEDVRLMVVDLPIANRVQRAAALPYAIEDQLAEPLEALHTALGAETAPGRYLAGVVAHERMVFWLSVLSRSGLGQAALVPDALALPLPPVDSWSVTARDDRVLVRTADGRAFAAPGKALAALWRGDGDPRIISHGGPLPTDFSAMPVEEGLSLWPALAQPLPLDLRQGRYGVASGATPWLKRAAAVLACGFLALALLYAIDTAALMGSAGKYRGEVRTLVAAAGGPTEGDLATTAEAMLPPISGEVTGLLPSLTQVGRALQPLGTIVSVQSMTYDDTGLTLGLEASDLAGLQRAEAALTTAGLGPASNGSTVEGGRARQQMVIPKAATTR